MSLKRAVAVAVFALVATGCATTNASKFSGTNKQDYPMVSGFFGHVAPGEAADETRGSREVRYVYAWLPSAAQELGVRMMTPVGDAAKPGPNDAVAPTFRANAKAKETFDPWIQVERCASARAPADVRNPCLQWQSLGENQDAAEEFGGDKKNAALFIQGAQPGLYRIGFGAQRGPVQGTYLLQVGGSGGGVVFARTLQQLAGQVR